MCFSISEAKINFYFPTGTPRHVDYADVNVGDLLLCIREDTLHCVTPMCHERTFLWSLI